MFDAMFRAHPRAVGETYFEHQAVALGFAGELFVAATACLVHAVVPGLCQKTGSRAIARLHDRMVVNRAPHAPVAGARRPA